MEALIRGRRLSKKFCVIFFFEFDIVFFMTRNNIYNICMLYVICHM